MVELIIIMGLAIAPGLALAVYVYYRDKFEKEPLSILILSFILGMISVVPAVIAEFALDTLPIIKNYVFVQAFIGIALPEELSKLLFILVFAYRKNAFNEPYDGITYSVMVSMGFATLENVLYVWQGGWTVAIMRMFTAVPAHATFGIIMGYYLGLSKFSKSNRFAFIGMAFFSSVLFHGAYDFFLMIEDVPFIWLGAIVSLVVGIYLSLRAIRIHNRNSPFST